MNEDIDNIVNWALGNEPVTVKQPLSSDPLPKETAPVPQPRTKSKPPQHKRWRCMTVGCNPILDEDTAQQHRAHTGHRVAKWPVRSQEGHKRQKKRNRSGYYDKYNVGAKSAEARGIAQGIRGGFFHVPVHRPFEDVDETEGYFDNASTHQGDNQ